MNKSFCLNCNKITTYTVFNKSFTTRYNNVCVTYDGQEAICNRCKQAVYIMEISNRNIENGNKKFREVLNIIQIEEINQIFKKYNIQYEELACLLRWDKQIFRNYLRGFTPCRKNSDILYTLLNSQEIHIGRALEKI